MNNHINKMCFNLSIRYLSRYNASSFKLQQYLQRKLFKIYHLEIQNDNELKANILETIQNIICKMIEYKYINDDHYAKSKTKELILQGKSKNTINYKLTQYGINKQTINTTLDELHNEDISLYSALKYMKKKRLGCFSTKKIDISNMLDEEEYLSETCINSPQNDKKLLQKQVAQMYRNGFTYDLIKQALSMSFENAEEILNTTTI